MTEHLPSLGSSVAREGRFTGADAVQASRPPPIQIAVRVPEVLSHLGRSIAEPLESVFSAACQQTGIPRTAWARIGHAETGAVEVFADDRPVALIPRDHGEHHEFSVDEVVEATHWALLRRLPTLLHEVDATRFSTALASDGPQLSREVLEYLLSNGVSLGLLAERSSSLWSEHDASQVDLAEALLDELQPYSVRVAVPETILTSLEPDDLGAVVRLRDHLQHRLGAEFPDLELSIDRGQQSRMRVFLNDVEGPWVRVAPGSDWQALVNTLAGLLLDHASWFVSSRALADAKRGVANVVYDLVEISDLNISDTELAACVRCLLVNRDSVRNLPRVLWHLIEASEGSGGDDEVLLAEPHMITPDLSTRLLHPHPEVAASEVRRGVAYEDWSGGEDSHLSSVVSLPLGVERELVLATDRTTLGAVEWRVVQAIYEQGSVGVVAAHSPVAIAKLRQALYCLPRPPRVIATRELPPDQSLPGVVQVRGEEVG